MCAAVLRQPSLAAGAPWRSTVAASSLSASRSGGQSVPVDRPQAVLGLGGCHRASALSGGAQTPLTLL